MLEQVRAEGVVELQYAAEGDGLHHGVEGGGEAVVAGVGGRGGEGRGGGGERGKEAMKKIGEGR